MDFFFFYYYYNRRTFHSQALRTLYGDPNLRVLTALKQLVPGKFRVSSMVGFKPKNMY